MSQNQITQTEIDNLPHPPQEWLDEIQKFLEEERTENEKKEFEKTLKLLTWNNIHQRYRDDSFSVRYYVDCLFDLVLECDHTGSDDKEKYKKTLFHKRPPMWRREQFDEGMVDDIYRFLKPCGYMTDTFMEEITGYINHIVF